MAEARSSAAVVALQGRLYICGGRAGFHSHPRVLSSVERFDCHSGLWETLPSMQEPRYGAAAVALGSRLFLCGGCSHFDAGTNTGECCDTEAGHLWAMLPPMSHRHRCTTAVLIDTHVYVCGGTKTHTHCVERFDTAGWSWQTLPCLAGEPDRMGPAVAALEGKLYVCGGCDGRYNPLCSADCFDPGSGQWAVLPPMKNAHHHLATAAAGGHLYVFGSGTRHDRHTVSAERFDAASGQWEELPDTCLQCVVAMAFEIQGLLYLCGDHVNERSIQRFEPESRPWEVLVKCCGRMDETLALM